MFLELFCKFCSEHFDILYLLLGLVTDFQDFFVDVSRKEVCTLSRVLSLIFYVFKQFHYSRVLLVFECWDFLHDVFQKVLHQKFSVFIWLQSLVNFYFDHLRNFIRDLYLFIFECVDLISDTVWQFRNFTTNSDFLLGSCHFFLFDPAVDRPQLRFKVWLKLPDQLVFPLKLSTDNRVHLVVPITQLISLMSRFLLCQSVFHIYSVLHIVNLSLSFFLLWQKSINKICKLQLKSGTEFWMDLGKHRAEFFAVLEVGYLEPS